MTHVTLIGLDIAKHVFHVVGLNNQREVVLRRKLGRSQIHKFFSQLDSTTIVLEACGSAHFWAREFQSLAHQAILKTSEGDASSPVEQFYALTA